jgi:SAM-dependent methyltransferase
MKLETQLALSDLNRRFYSERAAAFSASRNHPWPGWGRLLDSAGLRTPPGEETERFAVLDAGCGNGRFLAYLGSEWSRGFAYTGCDDSQELLDIAATQSPDCAETKFSLCDLALDTGLESLPVGPFGLVTLFGVLHHIPGAGARRALVAALANRVDVNGVLALTVWRFGASERFEKRVLPWAEYNATAEHVINEGDLDDGDVLLRWGDTPGPPRYCHFVDEREIDELLVSTRSQNSLEEVDRFCADGKSGDLNEYLVLRRTSRRQPGASRP